jgi:hypothetical protein
MLAVALLNPEGHLLKLLKGLRVKEQLRVNLKEPPALAAASSSSARLCCPKPSAAK